MKKILLLSFFFLLAVFASGQPLPRIVNDTIIALNIRDALTIKDGGWSLPIVYNPALPPGNEAKSLTAKNGEKVSFLQYVPTGTDFKPLIIFLHGLGERGSGDTNTLRNVESNEIPKLIRDKVFTQNFIVLSPQLNKTYGWWPTWYISEMLDYAKKYLNIDPSRIYLTGLSLGGGGTWAGLEDSVIASQVAAAAPVCGTCNYLNGKWIIQNKIPVWIFHAQDDGTVGIGCSGGAYNDLKKKGANVTTTFYQTGGHGIWGRAYSQTFPTTWAVNDPDIWPQGTVKTYPLNLYDWFLQYKKSGVVVPPPPPAKVIVARLFVNGMEIIVYSDKTVEVK